jgi:hypothetical protein
MKRELLGATEPDDAALREQIEAVQRVAAHFAGETPAAHELPWADSDALVAFVRETLPALIARAEPASADVAAQVEAVKWCKYCGDAIEYIEIDYCADCCLPFDSPKLARAEPRALTEEEREEVQFFKDNPYFSDNVRRRLIAIIDRLTDTPATKEGP